VLAIALALPGSPVDALWRLNPAAHAHFAALRPFSSPGLFAVGIATALIARGLLCRRRWAWWCAIALFVINAAGDAVNYALTRDLWRSGTGVVIAAGFLAVLVQPNMRAHFAPHS